MLVKLGSPINLNLLLADGNTTKYPSAVLRSETGVQIGTEIPLTHTAGGLYQDDSVLMPDTSEVTATYVVYDDVNRTQVSDLYCDVLDVYTLDRALAIVEALQASLNSLINGVSPVGEILVGFIEDHGSLEGFLLDNDEMLVGEIMDDGNLQGSVQDEDAALSGVVGGATTSLTGYVEC